MKKLFFSAMALSLAILSGLCEARPASSDSLTVEQAVRLTLESHPLVQQAGYNVAAADARVGGSRAAYYPDIALAGVYELLEPVPEISFPGLGTFKFYPANNYDVHLGLRQTLYDFGRVSTGVQLAESARRSATDYVDLVKSNLAYQTIAVFDAMLILHQSIVVLDEQIEALGQHLAVSVKKIQAGTATDFDSLTTEVRIATARNDRIDAAKSLETQEILLRQLTGLPPDFSITPKGAIDARPVRLSPDSVLAAARRARPELVVARDAENSANVQARLASLGDKPSLSLNVASGFKNGYIPDLNEWKANVAAGVLLMVPLFNGNRTRHQKDEAYANIQSAMARTADVERQVGSEVNQAIAGVKSSLEKIDNSAVQVAQAEAALTRARAQYDAGVATNLDLLDVQTALSQAKLIRLRAIYEYMVSMNALDRATGKKIW